jgi:plastocyanin
VLQEVTAVKRVSLALGIAGLVLATAAWRVAGVRSTPAGRVVIVKTVELSATSYRFEPAEITVLPGDTVRFVQSSTMPHNVEFTKSPKGSKLGTAKVGPYLVAPNQTYDVPIDARFLAGQYQFICTPHAILGMKGTISVASQP